MRLKYLVISDTHVGEPNSLLSFPIGLQELWYSLRTKFGQDNSAPLNTPLEVDELILLGDIPDRNPFFDIGNTNSDWGINSHITKRHNYHKSRVCHRES